MVLLGMKHDLLHSMRSGLATAAFQAPTRRIRQPLFTIHGLTPFSDPIFERRKSCSRYLTPIGMIAKIAQASG